MDRPFGNLVFMTFPNRTENWPTWPFQAKQSPYQESNQVSIWLAEDLAECQEILEALGRSGMKTPAEVRWWRAVEGWLLPTNMAMKLSLEDQKKKGQCSNYRDLSIFVVEWPVLSWVCTNTNVTLLCWVVAIKYIFLVGILLLGGHMGPNLRLQSVSFTSQALAKRIMNWFPAGRMSFNHKTLFCGSIRWSDSNFFFIFNSTGVAMTKVPLGATNKEI